MALSAGSLKGPDVVAHLNKMLGEGTALLGESAFKSIRIPRFSSGILSLDLALGGGWPFGRIAVVAGEYSTGKSEIALQACISVEKYDHSTRKHVLVSDPKTFVPGKALYVDIEGAFDPAWAASKGFNPENHIILRPETAEQAIDAIAWAIEANAVDLIILDSLAQMTPSKEIEASSEEWQMGLAARMNNKACRKWMSLLMARNKFPGGGPALLIINQFRLKVGLCFGDPRTLPGGKGQEFVSSIIAYTRSGKVTEGEAEVDLGGTVHKNKTFAPKKVYSFSMGLLESSKIGKAKIDNFSTLMDGMKRGGWLTGKAKAMSLAGTAIGDEDDLKKYLVANPTATLKWWNSVVKMDCGYSS